LPFFEKKIPFTNSKSYLSFIQLPYWRLPGFSTINRNDVVAFNYPQETTVPIDKRIKYLMRCAGIPGDSLKISNNELFINGKKTKIPLNPGFVQQSQEQSPDVFPQSNHFSWTSNNFGPIWVPGKGKTVKLSVSNYELYREVIENEGNYFDVKGNKIFINNLMTNNYTFKKNYYFMLDDNFVHAKDSRFWGFLPENHIIGKCNFVWFSFENDNKNKLKARWGRIFKKIT
jgi:signal peptidase I